MEVPSKGAADLRQRPPGPSLPGQSQAGFALGAAAGRFKKVIQEELNGESKMETPQGNLITQ